MSNAPFRLTQAPALDALLDADHYISFTELIQQVSLFNKPLSLAAIRFMLENVMLDDREVQALSSFECNNYCRKRLFHNSHCEILILSWLNGQRSKIHDHLHSACGVKVLLGQATETQFEQAENGHVYATQSILYDTAQISVSQDNDIHQISNLQAQNKPLITLHLYSPPLQQFHLYSLEESKPILFNAQQNPWYYEI
ncbi:cysteine dioxygenase family protein [uncultured Shewanella sp.]|uniref:cysteine dioxygenase n=1 Tax=uncultured Shewanella sp. TaxID=173975 RepID=UPI00262E218D|nr:cysteine dioxygenase family protein [uncultured Shewanella sp.]